MMNYKAIHNYEVEPRKKALQIFLGFFEILYLYEVEPRKDPRKRVSIQARYRLIHQKLYLEAIF